MDFTLSDEQREIGALASRILADHTTDDRLAELGERGEWHDAALLEAFANAGLLGVAVPEEHGGGGLGLIEIAVLLVASGASAARLPLHALIVLGALPVARFGSVDLRSRWLPALAAGTSVITTALEEPAGSEPLSPATRAVADDGGWRIDGVKTCVPLAAAAERLIVPAAVGDGRMLLALLDPKTPGVTLMPQAAGTGETVWQVALDGVFVGGDSVLVGPEAGAEALRWLVERAAIGLCALQLGAAEAALAATARWVSERRQFGRPLASFQAVSLRAADAYIALEGNRLTLWQAVWRLNEDLPAAAEVAIAKWWAAESGTVVLQTAHRLQGGVGVDMTSALPRYTLLSRQLEFSLGGARRQLRALGRAIAAGAA
jgi:alkylation response protein AidB-like acyl-CoA dehydrogenase